MPSSQPKWLYDDQIITAARTLQSHPGTSEAGKWTAHHIAAIYFPGINRNTGAA